MIIKQRPYLYNWTGNSVYYELYSAAALADASIVFEVRIFFKQSDAADYTLLTTLPLVPVQGSVKFNIQDILHAHLEYLMPDLHAGATVVEISKQSGSFYIDFREITAVNSNPPWDSSEVNYFRHILKGGIHTYQFKGNNYWLNYHPENMPFLTWQQSGRLASIRERMYLSWYCQAVVASPNLVARVVVTFTDASTATQDLVIANQLHRVYHIPAGATQLDLQGLGPAKRIWYWTIRVMDITDPDVPILLSQLFKYNLDNRNDYNDTTLHYRNSLGGIDSVRIRGVVETNLQYAITETTGLLESDYFMKDQLPALDSIHKAKETVVFRGDIGHLGKEEQDRLRDAFLNRQCFHERLSKWWPVKLLNANTRLRISTDKRFALPIEWQYADGGSYFYTPDINLGEGADSNNVCDCAITELSASVSFDEDFTVAAVQFAFGVDCDESESIDTVQYRIDGGEWIDMAYPFVDPLVISHPINRFGTADFRVKCPNGDAGPISTVPFDTHTIPFEPDPTPGANNVRIYNNLGYTQLIKLYINSTQVWQGTVANGGIGYYNVPINQLDKAILVKTEYITPVYATILKSSGLDEASSYFTNHADFGLHNDYLDGFDITLQ